MVENEMKHIVSRYIDILWEKDDILIQNMLEATASPLLPTSDDEPTEITEKDISDLLEKSIANSQKKK